ncbi:MAG: galactose oxidase-like domain-containing protein [Planctomycetota bacterium]
MYDWRNGTIIVQDLLWDLFCNGYSFLPDGRALVIGGSEQYDPFYGEARATAFDPATNQFAQVESMADGRWYATGTTLGDGRVLTFSGLGSNGSTNATVEFYQIGQGWSADYQAPWTPPLYPWLHLLPNGKLFFSGSTPDSHLFDPASKTWTLNVARTVYGSDRPYGSSVLLPLLPQNGYAPRVMIMGGHDPATATAEVINLADSTPKWRALPPMSLPRIEMNAVLLPNGKVLAQGGSRINEDSASASKAADLFDPVSETWSSASTAVYARLYHSVALLLPDATVWTAGSNPQRGVYEQHMEIYYPPYLFAIDPATGHVIPAPRPSITKAPAVIGYGGSFRVDTPNDLDIASIALMRPGSDTHAWDMDQRMVGLAFVPGQPGSLTVNEPPTANVAPPGYYMLFLVNRAGTPSLAAFVQVSPTPQNQPPHGTITSPSGNVTIQLGQSVTFAGSGSDPEGGPVTYSWIFPEGLPDGSHQQNPGAVTFTDTGSYVVSLTVLDNAGANDPSPPTRMITVLPPPLVVTITSPDEGARVKGTVSVKMSVSGASGSSNTFTLKLDGQVVDSKTVSGSSATIKWNSRNTSNGSHTLTASVKDATGNTGTSPDRSVTVKN